MKPEETILFQVEYSARAYVLQSRFWGSVDFILSVLSWVPIFITLFMDIRWPEVLWYLIVFLMFRSMLLQVNLEEKADNNHWAAIEYRRVADTCETEEEMRAEVMKIKVRKQDIPLNGIRNLAYNWVAEGVPGVQKVKTGWVEVVVGWLC